MLKKLLMGIAVGGTLVAFVGTASADTYRIVAAGASAQGKFWRTAGESFLVNEMGCTFDGLEGTTADQEEDAVMRGSSCSKVPGGTNNDIVIINYLEEASYFGCENAPGSQSITVADPSTCNFGDGSEDWDCTGTESIAMDVGCADVRCASINQTSAGWEDGRNADDGDNENYIENCENGDCDSTWTTYGDASGYAWDTGVYDNMQVREGVVVPFGIGVNNDVTKTRCVAPTDPTGDNIHMAYNKWGWQCVPGAQRCVSGSCEDTSESCTQSTRYVLDASGDVVLAPGACPTSSALADVDQSADCVGYYKCDHSLTPNNQTDFSGQCLDGNQGTGSAVDCNKPKDCSAAMADTQCVQQPIDNLSRLQALLIFSGQVNNWSAFGPWYPDLPIVQCMRHAGSGTHATLDKAIFRGDLPFMTETVVATYSDYNFSFVADWRECEDPTLCGTGANTPHPNATNGVAEDVTVWHYRSSTDLTYDCIDVYSGGIGYIDADKILGNDDVSNCHTIKLEGVEPTREKVKFGEYVYWSAQQCQYDGDTVPAVEQGIIEALMAYAADPANLTNEDFGTSADYWATIGEMTVQKTSDTAYPIAK